MGICSRPLSRADAHMISPDKKPHIPSKEPYIPSKETYINTLSRADAHMISPDVYGVATVSRLD